MPSILINGHETEHLSVRDRGFQYGDGLFETLRVNDGQAEYWQEHIARLALGCERLGILMPDASLLQAEADTLLQGISQGVLKLTITRGFSERGLSIGKTTSPNRILALYPMTDYPPENYLQGVTVRICKTRLGDNIALAGIKHLNRLEQVLARAEWDDPAIHEGLMLDSEDNIVEGTMSNIFCVHEGVLLTPDLSRCGVKGIIREKILMAAKKAAIPTKESCLGIESLYQASELFLTNSLIGIWPVKQCERHVFSVGPITRRLMHMLKLNVE